MYICGKLPFEDDILIWIEIVILVTSKENKPPPPPARQRLYTVRGAGRVYEFLLATVMNCHKLSGVPHYEVITLCFWKWEF